ncbi:putative RHS repeat-associated core domain protein [Winkia neuii]|nr:putative RHS repeat-associated core domain protein [Winkia neuii]
MRAARPDADFASGVWVGAAMFQGRPGGRRIKFGAVIASFGRQILPYVGKLLFVLQAFLTWEVAMAAVPKSIDEDVWNNNISVATENFLAACRRLLALLGECTEDFVGATARANQDFSGFFANLFSHNNRIRQTETDAFERVLASLIAGIASAREAAKAEQHRIEQGRKFVAEHKKWQREREAFWGGQWAYDRLHSEPEIDLKAASPGKAPQIETGPVSHTSHDVPEPGTVSGNAEGTSSAVAENLRAFVAAAQRCYEVLDGSITAFTNAHTTFEDNWKFKSGPHLIAGMDDFITTLKAFNQANLNDGDWVASIADAFQVAGGSGNVTTLSDQALYWRLQVLSLPLVRDRLEVPALSLTGIVPSTGYADDPVSTVTGNFVLPAPDFVFPARCSALNFGRTYNSVAGVAAGRAEGVFGLGWACALDQRLTLTRAGAQWLDWQGRQIFFPSQQGAWRSQQDNFWLSPTEQGYTVTDNSGNWWKFDSAGLWLSQGSEFKNAVSACRDSAGRACALVHERGLRIDFAYQSGLVVAANCSDGRVQKYSYQENRLVSVRGVQGEWKYVWQDPFLVEVWDPAGVRVCKNSYDEKGRVRSQVSQAGRTSKYTYLAPGVVSVSDLDGKRANSWRSNRLGQTTAIADSKGNAQQMGYDSHGNLTYCADRQGNVTACKYDSRARPVYEVTEGRGNISYSWDSQDRLVKMSTSAGACFEFAYEGLGRDPVKIVDPVGGVTTARYREGLLTEAVDPTGVRLSFSYDRLGLLVSLTNGDGHSYRFERDGAGRLVAVVSPLGERSEFSYDRAGRLVARTDPEGATTRFTYDRGGRLVSEQGPDGAESKLIYGKDGQIAALVDPLGATIRCEWDDLANLTSVVGKGGLGAKFTFDSLSHLTGFADAAGERWKADYDTEGNVVGVVDPTGVKTSFAYTPKRSVAIREGGPIVAMAYDELGRLEQIEDGRGHFEEVSYDAASLPVTVVDERGASRRVERDKAGRIMREVSEAGVLTSYSYDRCGRLCSLSRGGQRQQFFYDACSRLVRIEDSAGGVSSFTYDGCGRLTRSVIAGLGRADYAYDKGGRVIFARDLLYGTRRFAYDKAGRLTTATNGVGGKHVYSYDEAGRLCCVTDPAGGKVFYGYDRAGNLVQVTDPLGRKTSLRYDGAGRLRGMERGGQSTEYAYDKAGNLNGIAASGKQLFEIARKADALTVEGAGGSGSETLVFDRDGQLQRRCSGFGEQVRVWNWEYDLQGRRVAYKDPAGQELKYTYSAAGNLQEVWQDNTKKVAVGYDAAGNVVSLVRGQTKYEFSYEGGSLTRAKVIDAAGMHTARIGRDCWGRITAISTGEGEYSYSYNEAGQLVEMIGPAGERTSWQWDYCGRLRARQCGDELVEYDYDLAGQLVSSCTKTSRKNVQTKYVYDAAGRRVSERSSSGYSREFSWDELGRLKGLRVNGKPVELGFNLLGELEQEGGHRFVWDTAAAIPTFTSQTGAEGTSRTSVPIAPWRSIDPAHPFAGQGGPNIDGLILMGARVYDPNTQSFLSPDPLAAPAGSIWQANPYDYAGANPLALSDPLGLKPITDPKMRALRNYNNSRHLSVGDWVRQNKEYLLSAGLVVGGILVFATGVGGPLGAAMISGALISGGVSIGTQKYYNGRVSVSAVAKDALIGGALGGIGAGAGNLAKTAILNRSSVATDLLAGQVEKQGAEAGANTLWKALNNTGGRAQALKQAAAWDADAAMTRFTTDLAGDTVGNFAAANAGYGVDVARGRADLSLKGFVKANALAGASSTFSGTTRLAGAGVKVPRPLSPLAGLPEKVARTGREFAISTSSDLAANGLAWRAEENSGSPLTNRGRAADTLSDVSKDLGKGIRYGFKY